MHESQDRRSAFAKFAAGASAAVGAAMAVTGGAGAVVTERKRKEKVQQLWNGQLVNPVYTPLGVGDTVYYTITAQGGGDGTMDDVKLGRKVRMTDARLFKYMQNKSGGNYTGAQCLRLQDMNWRLLGVDYDEPANTWTLVVRVCDTNPDKRPNTGVGIEAYGDVVTTGCSCGCATNKCYECRNGYACGASVCDACGC